MDIGCHLPTQGPVATREALTRFCREAEQRGIAALWVSDHVVFPRAKSGQYPGGRFPHAPDTPYLEPVAVLAAAAIATERARLGSSEAAKRPFDTIELSMRVRNTGPLSTSKAEVIDLLGAYKKAGLTHVMLDVRRDSLTEMLENLDIVAKEIRPAVTRA